MGASHPAADLGGGGQTMISINGEVGNFFRNKRGLRQGDPLNIVINALSAMPDRARAVRNIKGVVAHLIQGGLPAILCR